MAPAGGSFMGAWQVQWVQGSYFSRLILLLNSKGPEPFCSNWEGCSVSRRKSNTMSVTVPSHTMPVTCMVGCPEATVVLVCFTTRFCRHYNAYFY